MNILQRPNRKGDKIYFLYDLGRGKGQRPSTGVFIYTHPKDQIQKNHNKQALALLETKKSQLTIEQQAIGSSFIPAHKFKANFLEYYEEYVKLNARKGNRHLANSLARIYLSRERPHLYFQLIDRGPFYHLEMKVSLKGNTLKHFDAISTFFICNDKTLYFLPTLKDVGITEWMRKCHNRITVFKEHFSEFEKEYLEPLSDNYRLEIIPSKN